MIKTKLTEMLGIKYPLVQSGMQWLAIPEFASAVCNAGGIGTINVTCWPTLEEFADQLDKMNSLTSKPYIVNISLAPTQTQRLDSDEIRRTIKI
jgi:nitronate monooxygenase